MRQTELIGFIIEQGKVTSGEVARRFNVPITFAHQALRRLEERGLLIRDGGPRRFTFELSPEAKNRLDNLLKNSKGYGWVFLLGLAVGLLIGFSSPNQGERNNEKENKKRDSTFL